MNPFPAVIAHRGFSSRAPENTLAAIQAALAAGADMVEVDVLQSSDGVPVIFHDFTLERTTNGKGEVRNHTLAQLKRLDAGSWFSKTFSNETIPTLEECLALTRGKATLLLEIKAGSSYFKGIEERIIEVIKRENAEEWVIIQSFETDVLKAIRKQNPTVRLHKLVTGNIPVVPLYVDSKVRIGRIYKYKYVDAINISYRLLNRRKLKRIRERGQKVFVWTVNETSEMEKLLEWGVDGIITDYPERLLTLKAKHGSRL